MMSSDPHIDPVTIISNDVKPVMSENKIASLLLSGDVTGLSPYESLVIPSVPEYGVSDCKKIAKHWYDIKDVEKLHRENLRNEPNDSWALSCLETIRILKIHVAQFNFKCVDKTDVESGRLNA